jgi:ornithine decarboxylase
MNAPVHIEATPRFATPLKAIESLKPGEPLYLVQPEKFAAAARIFLTGFPGDVLYALKANPHPIAVQNLWAAGIRHFDTASLGEIEIVKTLFPPPSATSWRRCGWPVMPRRRSSATASPISWSTASELDKLLSETGSPNKIRIFVRLVAQLGRRAAGNVQQVWLPSRGSGQAAEAGAGLGRRPCLTFHVGSQCLSPFSYAQAIEIAQRTINQSGVAIAALDIGGGFPTSYAGQEAPPYHWYFDMIKEALVNLSLPGLPVMCEPGRALVAQGISLVTQVLMRRGDRLYINDGIYGSFDEQRFAGFDENYPPTGITLDAKGNAKLLGGEKRPFRVYGPTCDSMDVLPRPQMLPEGIDKGDYILFDAMGAYTVSSRSSFNGFYPDSWAIIEGPGA